MPFEYRGELSTPSCQAVLGLPFDPSLAGCPRGGDGLCTVFSNAQTFHDLYPSTNSIPCA